jgi:hypothetical protein
VSSTSIGTRRADYKGGPVTLPSDERSPDRWFNTAAFTAPPAGRVGSAGFGTVLNPGLHLWDFSFRKQFSLTERAKLRFQADMFNAFNKANLKTLSVTTTSRDFGSLTAAGPGRDVQMGLKLTF